MKSKIFALFIILLFIFTSCGKNEDEVTHTKTRPVKIIKLQEENRPISLNYIGLIAAAEIKKISFKSSGKIEKFFVSKGEKIKKGDILTKLDTEDLEYALEASKANTEAARSQYEKAINGARDEEIKQVESNTKKAQDAYDFAKDNYIKVKSLFEEGAISQNTLDKAKLEMDIKQSDLRAAKEMENQIQNSVREEDKKTLYYQLQQAEIDYNYKKSLLEAAELKADIDGYIVDVLYKEGEMISEGYPVVVIRNDNQIVNVGLSQNDTSKVELGDKVIIKTNSMETTGKISSIDQIPNMETRTYNAEVSIDERELQLSTIVEVDIIVGEEKGIWIPVTAILSNEVDYVFIIKEDTAVKKKIEIKKIEGTRVKIKGLSAGEALVIEGMKRLRDGDKIIIQE